MDKMYLVLVLLVAGLVVFAGVQAVQIADIKAKVTSGAVTTSSGNLDTSGWTADEKMNYEMHGVIPARASGSAPKPAQSAMVGGC